MRKFLGCLCIALAGLSGCSTGGQSGSEPNPPHITAVQVTFSKTSIAAGYTEGVRAIAASSDGSTQDVTASARWTSSDLKVASVSQSGGQAIIKALAPGVSQIQAAYQGISGEAALSVTNAVLRAITVNPGSASIALGLTQQFKAVGTFSDASTADITSTATWVSSNAEVVAISNTGLASTKEQGSSMISAALAGVSGAAAINVEAAQLLSIAVTPPLVTVSAGSSQPFTATGTYTDGSAQDVTQIVTWASLNPSVAILSGPGLVQTVIAGVATVTAMASAGIQGAATLTATQSKAAIGVHIGLRANIAHNPGLDNYSDVVGDGTFAYMASWHNTSGVEIYDISNPDVPVYVTTYLPPNGAKATNFQGIQVLNGIGYFASDDTGDIYIIDLSNPAHPADIGQITHQQLGQNNVHDITLDATGQHLFVPGYPNSTTVQVWNVTDPLAPKLVQTLTGSDPNTVHDVTIYNNLLFLAGWGVRSTGVESSDIFDISNIDTQQPVLLASFQSGVDTQDASFSSDGKYLFCPHELAANGDVAVFDISNPSNPKFVSDIQETQLGLFATSPSTSKIMGNNLFVAWYQAGLAVFDVTDPTNPILIGNYDTWPGFSFGGVGGGDGSWGVWPFLGMNKVLVSDRTTGLYVLDTTGVSSQAAVLSVGYSNNPLTGSTTTAGTVFLVGIAPSAGWPTTVTSANTKVAPSSSVLIPAGAHSANFPQITNAVTNKTAVGMTASDGIFQSATTLTVLPAQLSSISFNPNSVTGGNLVTGTVNLNITAPANITVSLAVTSGASAVASMPGSVVVPAGSSSASWSVQTNTVASATTVTVKASANGGSLSGTFVVQ